MAELINKYKNLKNLKIIGEIGRPEVRRYYECSRFTIVPSQNEPFGYVALESIIFGALPLVSDCTGIIEIVEVLPSNFRIPVNPIDHFTFKVDIKTLADKMVKIYRMPENDRLNLINQARIKNMEKFNYLKISSQWLQLIDKVTSRRE